MTGKRTSNGPAPKISYVDAMRIKLNGELVCTMQAATFAAWVEQAIAGANAPEVVRGKLAGHDYTIFADRWHAMLILKENGTSLQAD
jgi:hypothetical protein